MLDRIVSVYTCFRFVFTTELEYITKNTQ